MEKTSNTPAIRCGDCRNFFTAATKTSPEGKIVRHGYCDEFGGVPVTEDCGCDGAAFHPLRKIIKTAAKP